MSYTIENTQELFLVVKKYDEDERHDLHMIMSKREIQQLLQGPFKHLIKSISKFNLVEAENVSFNDRLKGKVCIYEDKEYVIREAGFCEKFYIWGYKIDERYPWTTTDKEIYITEAGCGFGRGVNAKFSEVQFTDEVFEDRKKRVEELEE